jgi:uncharacterized protein YidB (DUF937 family)
LPPPSERVSPICVTAAKRTNSSRPSRKQIPGQPLMLQYCRQVLTEMAKSAGIPVDKVKDLLAECLPIAIDKATPEGKLPPRDLA